jgi:hypothetical protein
MKKRKVLAYLLATLLFSTVLFSCGNKKPDNYNEEIYRIYELVKEDGYQGTYEEWLDSIKGEKGDTGSQGEKGDKGDPGKDGTSLLTGYGRPSNDNGINGDSFIDLSSWDFYIKVNEKWILKGNIKGDSAGQTPIYNTEGLVFTPINDTECSVSIGKGKERFLKEIIPVAEECDVKMAIHPDDPPYPIFGLPRIITNEQNIDRFLKIVDSPYNSLCFCTGSLGCASFNDIPKMVQKYAKADRIAFMHIRNVLLLDDGSFEERAHLSSCGSIDAFKVVKALVENGFTGYVRPDHGRMIWGETGKPGYGLFDRALGATYINGLFEALEKEYK